MLREMTFYRWIAILLTALLVCVLGVLIVDWVQKSLPADRTPTPAATAEPSRPIELLCVFGAASGVGGQAPAQNARGSASPPPVACSLPSTAAAPAFASGPAQEPEPRSVDASINVIAIVIAVVTLILTVGTSWFTQKQVEIAQSMQVLEQRREMGELLVHARADLIRGLTTSIGPRFAAADGQLLAVELELLQSPNEKSRKRAFQALLPYFDPDLSGDYPGLLKYTIACSRLVPRDQESWCGLFDAD